jgi:DNA polymerase
LRPSEKQPFQRLFGKRKPLKRLLSTVAQITGLKVGVNKNGSWLGRFDGRDGGLRQKKLLLRGKFPIVETMTQPALDFVIAALQKIRESSDGVPRASMRALAQLQTVSPVAVSLRETSASPTRRSPQPASNKAALLDAIRERVCACTQCAHLARSRTQTVFGVGNPDADLMFIGEAPGADEDQQGEPFVGRAGQLLTRILKAMNFARDDVYIANILKCRPDTPSGSFGNRAPTPVEMQTCRPYLLEQINVIQPKVLVALGAVAVEGLLGLRSTMREVRGRWHAYNGIPLMITYHPAYLLRNQAPSEKRKVWEDMLQVLERLEQPISERQRNYFL